jgi:hypothetical protein
MTAQEKLQTAFDVARQLARGFVEEAPELVAEALSRLDTLEKMLRGATAEEQDEAAVTLARETLKVWASGLRRRSKRSAS